MQQIQIARGLLQKRLKSAPLAFGELFFDTTLGKDKRNIYIGLKDGNYTRIGGEKSLHFRGEWDHATSLPSENVVIGDVYKLLQDVELEAPADPNKRNFPEYYKGDLIIAAAYEKDADGNDTQNIIWVKVASNGGDASNVKFNNEYTNFVVDNQGNICVVQDALVYIDRNKLSYGGTLQVALEGEVGKDYVEVHTEKEILEFALSTLRESNSYTSNPAGFYFAIPRDMKIGDVQYYENDFVVITSTEYDNSLEGPVTYKLQRMPGGAHSADKIDVNSEEFAREPAAEAIYNEDDSAITNVQTALNQLFKTKADLDKNNKIVLNQIPDTIIGTIDYQGIVKPEGNKIIIPKHLDINTEEQFEDDKFIQKGDYWVYQGDKLPLDSITLVDPNGNPIALNSKTNVNGDEAYINNGDWFIASEDYSQDGEIVFDILDNTAPFVGITCGDNEGTVKGQDTLDGTVNFTGNVREGAGLREATVTKNEIGNGVLISSPNAALIADIANAALFKDYILKVNEFGVLVKGHIKDVDNGIQLEGYNALDEASGTASTIKQKIVVNKNASRTEETTITLPKNSGTLVTHEEVGLADGKDNYNVMFNFDEKTQQTVFVESPMEMHNPVLDENGNKVIPVTAEGFIFHRNVDSATQVLFRPDEVGKEHGNTVQVMPPLSGVLLNTNSIIDCGYWGEKGLEIYENEPGKLDKYPQQFNTLESYEEHLISLAGGSDYATYSVILNNELYSNVITRSVRENGFTYFPLLESNKLYTFVGWEDEDGNQYPITKDTLSPEITKDTTFKAVWTTNTVAVILKDIDDTTLIKTLTGEDAIYTKEYNIPFDAAVTESIAPDENYQVVGWTRSKEGATNGYVEITNEDGTKSKIEPNTTDSLLNNYGESEYYDISDLNLESGAKSGYNLYRLRNPKVTVDAYQTTEDNERVLQESIFNGYVKRGFVDTAFTTAIDTFIKNNINYGKVGEGYNFYIEDEEGNTTPIDDILTQTFTEPTTIIALYESDQDDKYTSVYELDVDGSTITYELIPHYTEENWKQELFDDLGLGNLYDVNKIDLITFNDVNGNEITNPVEYLNRQSSYDNPIIIGITIQEDIEAHLEDN